MTEASEKNVPSAGDATAESGAVLTPAWVAYQIGEPDLTRTCLSSQRTGAAPSN